MRRLCFFLLMLTVLLSPLASVVPVKAANTLVKEFSFTPADYWGVDGFYANGVYITSGWALGSSDKRWFEFSPRSILAPNTEYYAEIYRDGVRNGGYTLNASIPSASLSIFHEWGANGYPSRYTKVTVKIFGPDTIPPKLSWSHYSGTYEPFYLTLSADETDAKIYFSIDGGASWILYSGSIRIDKNVRVTAYAIDSAGNRSQNMTQEYIVDSTPLEVSISPASGEFEDSLTVTITSSKPSTIYYSLGGAEPSQVYTSPLTITDTTTVKAKAVMSSGTTSVVVSAVYTKRLIQPTLSFNPSSTSFSSPFDMTIISNYGSAQIYYSLDGSSPSVLYTGAVRISKKTTVKAKAVYKGVSSPVYEITYDKAPIQHTDEKFFKIPVSMDLIKGHSMDVINVSSPGFWMFAVAFLGLLILGFMKGVFKK